MNRQLVDMHDSNDVIHPKVKAFMEVAPLLKDLFPQDFCIGVSDRKSLVASVGSLTIPALANSYVLQPGDGMYEAVLYKTVQKTILPKEVFGFPVQANAIPLYDETGNVIGAVGVASSLEQYNKLFDIATKLSAAVEQVTVTVGSLASSVTSFSSMMGFITSQSNAVLQSAQEIESVANMVRDVSSHSQILGLNASIEAARAGEYGRGFSVVAKEIQKMAFDSKEHTDTIRTIVIKVEDMIKQLHASVSKSHTESNSQATAIEEIAATMQEISENAHSLASYAEKLVKG